MSENKALVVICSGHAQADKAIAELHQVGFDMKHVSVLRKAFVSDEEIVGCYVADGRLMALGGSAAFWEQLWSLPGGAGLFVVPGIGPVVIAGPLVDALAATVKDAVIIGGLTALGAASYSIGIPKEKALKYEREMRANKCILIAVGTPEEEAEAKAAIETAQATESVMIHG